VRRSLLLVLSVASSSLASSLRAQPAATSASAVRAPLAPRAMPAGRYEFTRTDDDGDVSSGAVVWNGQLLRIDMDRSRDRARRGNSSGVAVNTRRGEYIVVNFATGTVHSVKPQEREISEMPIATFEQIIGKALGMVSGVVQMRVRDAGILARDVGPGGTVAGVPTHQYRLIEEFNVKVGVFGMSAEEKHHRVVTDYWVPTDADMPRNPMFEILLRSASPMSQQDATHQSNIARAKAALFAGNQMKAIVTVTEQGESPKRSSIEVTSLSARAPDAALFALPAGYRIKKNDLTFSL
jgi:hypothetical protein